MINKELDVIDWNAEKKGSISVPSSIFDECRLTMRGIIHQVIRAQLLKKRAGTSKTLTVSEVSGSTKKMGKQKGGGCARHGSRKRGIYIKGAVVFGPRPRSYEISINKKLRKLAIKGVLSQKLNQGNLFILDDLSVSTFKTKNFKIILDNLGQKLPNNINMNSVLIVDESPSDNLVKASAGLYRVDVLPVKALNVLDICSRDNLIMSKSAINSIIQSLS